MAAGRRSCDNRKLEAVRRRRVRVELGGRFPSFHAPKQKNLDATDRKDGLAHPEVTAIISTSIGPKAALSCVAVRDLMWGTDFQGGSDVSIAAARCERSLPTC